MHGQTALTNLQPSSVHSYYLPQKGIPEPATVSIHEGEGPVQAVKFPTEAEVSYPVPAGQNSFSGVLVYRPSTVKLPESEPKTYVPILVRIRVEDKTVLEQVMDGVTPSVFFSIPMAGAKSFTIESKASFLPGEFFIAKPEFAPAEAQIVSLAFPASGQGFIDYAPVLRQAAVGVYYPGETVTVKAYLTGSAASAHIKFRMTPEWTTGSAVESEFDVPFHAAQSGVVRGSTNWKVPGSFGVFRLETTETVSGQPVFQRNQRICIAHQVNLASVSDGDFGVHVSFGGYPMLYDEFAGLWGAKWGRIFVRWPIVEYTRGKYDFSRLDDLLAIYRAQNMKVLVVVGEDAPSWLGPPGPEYYPAWSQFVTALAAHTAGRVDAWDVFNEIDAKFYPSLGKAQPGWDNMVLRSAMQILGHATPGIPRVCCSTVSTYWLAYNKRLFDSGLLSVIDAVSLHPYKLGGPEQRDGVMNYQERIEALRNLVGAHGANKPIWATEANWILGPRAVGVPTESRLTELDQAEYVVRVNLISTAEGVKFFLHSGFVSPYRAISHVGTLAAYTEMASLFANATHTTVTQLDPQVYEVTASTVSGEVGALWSAAGEATAHLNGRNVHFYDMYGNSLSMDPAAVHLSAQPVYFTAVGPTQSRVLTGPPAPNWHVAASLSSWTCARGTSCAKVEGGGQRVESQPSKGAHQLDSPLVSVQPGRCYMARIQLMLDEGAVAVFAVDPNFKTIDPAVYAAHIPDGKPRTIEARFHPTSDHMRISISNANYSDTKSVFTILGDPQIADCQ